MAVLETLEQEMARLVRVLEAVQRRRNYPLERAQYLLLLHLEAAGPQPVRSLAEHLLLDDSTVTRQVAAMEQAGLVRREPNPSDGRSSLIEATAEGIDLMAQMRDMRLGRVAILFEGWDEADKADLARLLTALNESLRRSIAE